MSTSSRFAAAAGFLPSLRRSASSFRAPKRGSWGFLVSSICTAVGSRQEGWSVRFPLRKRELAVPSLLLILITAWIALLDAQSAAHLTCDLCVSLGTVVSGVCSRMARGGKRGLARTIAAQSTERAPPTPRHATVR
ncbi:hypothetical protein DMC30DRAFT_106126 [Rhodotorula diobovata]|uniref:Uncharacterized protein n=1 Tax=Rhodotorula diobovata TaxID=5288 RepID=A0A5C5FMI8_9BASI|nr:hypothetical protein DMC30DRAFT_106126 [Rhodotorula diobovata]